MTEARSPRSFGVSGNLSETCRIFYSSDIRSRNIGRFSDLISAKLREENTDELRLRLIILFSIFQSYSAQGKGMGPDVEVLPVSLEVGLDDAQLAIGVSFHWREGLSPILPGLSERVEGGQFQTSFEETLVFLRQFSSSLIVKYEQLERRIEIVTLVDRSPSDRRDPFQILEIISGESAYAEASEYIEMGDLDHLSLLKEDTAVAEAPSDNQDESQTLKGSGADGVDATRISNADEASDSESVVKGSEEVPALDYGKSSSQSRWMPGFLKKVLSREGGDAPTSEPESVATAEGSVEQESEQRSFPPLMPELADEETQQLDPQSQQFMDKFQNLLGHMDRDEAVMAIVGEIREQADPVKGNHWAEGLMSQLMMEKARVTDLSKELDLEFRRKENDFRSRERSLRGEIRRLEEVSKRKDLQAERFREQVAQLNLAVERAKGQASSESEQQLRHKLGTTQKILKQKEEELSVTVQKLKSAEDRLLVAQARSSRSHIDPQLNARLQAAERKADEYKRVNQRLTEALNSQKQSGSKEEVIALKKKIETMERQSTEMRKNFERAQQRLRELQESERKIQAELNRTLAENRSLRGTGSGDGSGSASGGEQAA